MASLKRRYVQFTNPTGSLYFNTAVKNLRRSDTHNALSLFRRTSQCFAIIFSNNKDECTAIDSFSFNGSSVRSLRN